jgi:hypothetical protein
VQNDDIVDRVFNALLGSFLLSWLALIGLVPIVTLIALAFK